MAAVHLEGGGTGGELGFPAGREASLESPAGTAGTCQAFEGGSIASGKHGTYGVPEALWTVAGGHLGFPVAAVARTFGDVAVWQRFEAGRAYSSEGGTFAVREEIAQYIADYTAQRGIPVSPEEEVPGGRVQRFQGYRGTELAVYSSDRTGVHAVSWTILDHYDKLGGPGSGLGLPVADTIQTQRGRRMVDRVQRFEHGAIYKRASSADVFVVAAETTELTGDRLGWPASPERHVAGSRGETIQHFEKGVVTLRDGKREIWLRPEPEPAAPSSESSPSPGGKDVPTVPPMWPGFGRLLEGPGSRPRLGSLNGRAKASREAGPVVGGDAEDRAGAVLGGVAYEDRARDAWHRWPGAPARRPGIPAASRTGSLARVSRIRPGSLAPSHRHSQLVGASDPQRSRLAGASEPNRIWPVGDPSHIGPGRDPWSWLAGASEPQPRELAGVGEPGSGHSLAAASRVDRGISLPCRPGDLRHKRE
jgi:hypothetical protein